MDSDDQRRFPAEARRAVHGACSDVEPKVRSALPRLPATIELVAQTGSRVIPEVGATGMVVSSNRIVWIVDPHHSGGIAAVAQTYLGAMLAHESHHLARGWLTANPSHSYTLMDAVVSEGLATAFQREVSGVSPPWGEYPDEVRAWVEELLRLKAEAPYRQWMFQHPDGRRWIGYKAGTYIADQAFKSVGCTAAELASTPTQDILQMAGF